MITAGAMDIGATNTRIGLITKSGEIRSFASFPTDVKDKDSIILSAIECLKKLCSSSHIDIPSRVGVSVASPVNIHKGTIENPPNIPFEKIPVADILYHELKCKVSLLNDCSAAVYAESNVGTGKDFDPVIYITISTGIGSGIYTNGQILLGRDGNAGEIGHFFVDSSYLLPCNCGGCGHFEAYASGNMIPYFFYEWCRRKSIDLKETLSADEILNSALEGEPVFSSFLDFLVTIYARAFSSVIVAYDPEILILDGPVIREHSDIIPMIKEKIDGYLPLPEIKLSMLDGKASLIGAGLAVLNGISITGR